MRYATLQRLLASNVSRIFWHLHLVALLILIECNFMPESGSRLGVHLSDASSQCAVEVLGNLVVGAWLEVINDDDALVPERYVVNVWGVVRRPSVRASLPVFDLVSGI